MNQSVQVSVVTPSFNQGRFIERTIKSVLDQDIPRLEMLIVDGASTDTTLEVLGRHSERVRWYSEPDKGQADAINKGLRLARGSIIGWLNSDDVYYPGSLQKVLEFFAANPDCDLVYGNAEFIDENDRLIQPYYTEAWDPQRLRDVCFLCQPAVFFRSRVVQQFGPLDASLHYCMDYEYWLRLAQAGATIRHIEPVLAGSRLYPTTKTLGSRLQFHAEINRMLRNHLGYVPDRWITNEAHTLLDMRGMSHAQAPARFAVVVSLLSIWLSLKWNHGVSRTLRKQTSEWIVDNCEPHLPARLRRAMRGVARLAGR